MEGRENAVAYVRVSTDNQDVASQKDKISDFALKNGYEINQWFVDESISGAEEERPQLLALKNWVEKGNGGTVIMVGIDRLARDSYIFAKYQKIFDDYQVKPIYINAPTIGEPAIDTLLQSMLGAFAAYEKNIIKERFNRGKKYLLNQNSFSVGGKSYYGVRYVKSANGYTCVIDPEEAEIVKEIFNLYTTAGYSKNAIAQYLNEKGVPTCGKNYIKGKVAKWGIHTISFILSNESYIGKLIYGKTVTTKSRGVTKIVERENKSEQICLSTPQIISLDTFEKAKLKSRSRENKWGKTSPNKTEYLLKGLVKCSICGRNFVGVSGCGTNRYYRCGSLNHKQNCGNKAINASKLDTIVWKQLEAVLCYPENVEKTINLERGKLSIERDNLERIAFKKDQRLKEIEKEEKKLLDSFLKEIYSPEQIKEKKKALEIEKNKLTDEITDIKEKILNISNLVDAKLRKVDILIISLKLLAENDYSQAKGIVNKYIKNIVVSPKDIEISFLLPVEKRIVTQDKTPESPVRSNNIVVVRKVRIPNIKKRRSLVKYLTDNNE